jgi:hypothetical protein
METCRIVISKRQWLVISGSWFVVRKAVIGNRVVRARTPALQPAGTPALQGNRETGNREQGTRKQRTGDREQKGRDPSTPLGTGSGIGKPAELAELAGLAELVRGTQGTGEQKSWWVGRVARGKRRLVTVQFGTDLVQIRLLW